MTEQTYLTSASVLIKSLRAPSDPPAQNGPSKIHIALEAWSTTNFHIPRKAEILRDWVVDTWARTSFFANSPPPSLLPIAAESFSILFTSREMLKSEAWVEVWISMLKYLSAISPSPDLTSLNAQATTSCYPIYAQAFLHHSALRTSLNKSLASILFHPINLAADPLLPILNSSASLAALPTLFQTLVVTYHSGRFNLFTQASSSKVSHDVFVASKEREAVRNTLEDIVASLDGLDQTAEVWQCRAAVWRVIAQWGGYMEREPAWNRLVHNEARKAEAALVQHLSPILDLIATLEQLDHDQARLSDDVVRWCIAVSNAQRFLADKADTPKPSRNRHNDSPLSTSLPPTYSHHTSLLHPYHYRDRGAF
ncbi:hypothetical protein IAR55_004555 [Kwoniella newhampshirensis]|uniref:Pre-rRNA-processing protein las1 n=1 Tax=Kwoniella newhampshirensis TaxID=1651941 RepID=A0AAW0YY32_9TREE